jgi:hypothetical protein
MKLKPVKICVETRSAPASLAATHRGFAFYVAHPIRFIHLLLVSASLRSFTENRRSYAH